MSKAVLISIRPEWCEKIMTGQKTIEVRKTRPKMDPPFKCYIYCTKPEEKLLAIMKDGEIVQTGTSEEILTEPANAYVERFVENVDRSKIITASSIMVDKPLVARLKKEGPEVLIRKMRERNLTVLPVVDAGNILIGEVRLNDLIKLRKEQIRSIDTVVRHEVHSVLSDAILEDILPLMTRTNSPIWVVNENREFQGVVPLSSLIIEVTGKNKEEINEIIQNAIEL